MKLLFVYDMRVWENGDYYYTTSITQEVIDRYRALCGSVSWCTCVIPNDDTLFCQKYNPIARDTVDMISIHKINTLKGLTVYRKENSRLLEKSIREAERVLIRLPSMIGGEAVRLCRKYGKPYMIELVSCTWDALWNHSIKGKLLAPLSWFMTRKYVKYAPRVLYVTNQFLQSRYPSDGIIVGCSDVSLPAIDKDMLTNRLQYIRQRSMNERSFTVGTLAAVNVRYKGQEDVIKAIARLKHEGICIEYELAGGGDPGRLKELAAKLGITDQIHFLGSVPHDKVFSWFQTLDLYIQPSKQEGLPRAVVEAMSCACPVCGAKTGGIPELVGNGWIFSPGNVGEIIKILKKAISTDLSNEAKRSFQLALNYQKDRLEEIRNNFYREFAK